MLDCPHCHLGNLPYEQECRHCHKEMQSADEAWARRREWDALPTHLRDEYERNFKTLDSLQQDHRTWWAGHRRSTMITGGAAMSFGMVMIAPSCLGLFLDFGVGALITYWLFNIKGGRYKGMGLFFLGFVVCIPINAGSGFIERHVGGGGMGGAAMGVLFFCVGFLLIVTTGYFLGFKLDSEHGEHATVA